MHIEENLPDRSEIREAAVAVLKKWGKNREVCLQVQALMNGLDDTLTDEFVLKKLRGLKKTGTPFKEVFAERRAAGPPQT